jgi:subtilisin family serine protease
MGIGGIAPGVTLVNIRAGQDSGFFFVQPTVDALTYAGDIGVDVANMSFFVDPWLFNCPHRAGESSDLQLEQRTINEAVNRALDYAHNKAVTLVAAAGNESSDLANPRVDTTSPDFPDNSARRRSIDRSCLTMPSQGHHVIQVSSINRSGDKATYSNYGLGQIAVTAPGGALNDDANGRFGDPQNVILSPEPRALAREQGDIDAAGNPTNPFVVVDCERGQCATYQYLQGTSMASPHAAGIAALIVSAFGTPDSAHPGSLRMDPASVRAKLIASAKDRGNRSFFGAGLVDALRALAGTGSA